MKQVSLFVVYWTRTDPSVRDFQNRMFQLCQQENSRTRSGRLITGRITGTCRRYEIIYTLVPTNRKDYWSVSQLVVGKAVKSEQKFPWAPPAERVAVAPGGEAEEWGCKHRRAEDCYTDYIAVLHQDVIMKKRGIFL